MRIVHISDTHLGFGAYSRLDPEEGVNQREIDFYKAFEQAVDKTIKLKPDLVVHAGDLFDAVRPQNRAIDFALRQLIRLSESGAETVLISGNHSTPKLRETGNIFRIFEHLDHVHPIHEGGATPLTFGDTTVTAIPHSSNPPMAEILRGSKPSRTTRYNILLLHAGVTGAQTYKTDEFNEQTVPLESLSDGWDYVALGHFHQFNKIASKVCYSGSTERLGFGEAGQKKGIIELDLERQNTTFHELKIRDMDDLEGIDASGFASSEIVNAARDKVSALKIDDKIVRLVVRNVSSEAYRSLDVPAIRRFGSAALHFELKIERLDAEGNKTSEDSHIGVLADEFSRYVSGLSMSAEKKTALIRLGMPYLTREQE